MELEMNSIHANGTPTVPCRWVYRLKQTTHSPRPKYKAWIIAKGFRQEYGVDFDEVFSPGVKMTTLQFLLGVVAT